MSASIKDKYYIRLDIGEQEDVFDTESFTSYRIRMRAGGFLPHLVVEFNARGELADKLKSELRETTTIKLYEGIDRDNAKITQWTVVSPSFRNFSSMTEFRVECLLFAPGYDSQNLTDSITGTSIDVLNSLSQDFIGRPVDAIASPTDEMTWQLGLTTPQEAVTRTQIRYWSETESPNTALAVGIMENGPMLVRDIAMTVRQGPSFELIYDNEVTSDVPQILCQADYVVYPHDALQSRVGGVNRVAGAVEILDDAEAFVDIFQLDDIQSPFRGSRIQPDPTYDTNLAGRIDWNNMEDLDNVHDNWTRSRNVNIAQLTRCLDVNVRLVAPQTDPILQELKLLDIVLFKEQTFDRQLLEAFSGLYMVKEIERFFQEDAQSIATAITISRDGT